MLSWWDWERDFSSWAPAGQWGVGLAGVICVCGLRLMPHLHTERIEAWPRKCDPNQVLLGILEGPESGSSVRWQGEGPSNMLYLCRFHFLLEKKEEISVFLCFFFFFNFSDRSEIRSGPISLVEKKEAEATTRRRFPGQNHPGRTQGDPPPTKEGGSKGFMRASQLAFSKGLALFRLLIFPNEVLFTVVTLLLLFLLHVAKSHGLLSINLTISHFSPGCGISAWFQPGAT